MLCLTTCVLHTHTLLHTHAYTHFYTQKHTHTQHTHTHTNTHTHIRTHFCHTHAEPYAFTPGIVYTWKRPHFKLHQYTKQQAATSSMHVCRASTWLTSRYCVVPRYQIWLVSCQDVRLLCLSQQRQTDNITFL